MRIVGKKNRSGKLSDKEFLDQLSLSLRRLLKSRGLSQLEIERVTGVDQTIVSRAKNRRLKRVTQHARLLKLYADMRIKKTSMSAEVKRAATLFMGAGGSEEELLDWIRHGAGFILRHRKSEVL